MNENVGLFSGVVSGKGREKFLRGVVRSDIERVKTSNGRQLVLEFEHTAHESLLVPQIEGDARCGQLLANRPSDGVFARHTEDKGRFSFQSKHEKPPRGLGVVRYTKPLSVAYEIVSHRLSSRPKLRGHNRGSQVGENIVEVIVIRIGKQVVKF